MINDSEFCQYKIIFVINCISYFIENELEEERWGKIERRVKFLKVLQY